MNCCRAGVELGGNSPPSPTQKEGAFLRESASCLLDGRLSPQFSHHTQPTMQRSPRRVPQSSPDEACIVRSRNGSPGQNLKRQPPLMTTIVLLGTQKRGNTHTHTHTQRRAHTHTHTHTRPRLLVGHTSEIDGDSAGTPLLGEAKCPPPWEGVGTLHVRDASRPDMQTFRFVHGPNTRSERADAR